MDQQVARQLQSISQLHVIVAPGEHLRSASKQLTVSVSKSLSLLPAGQLVPSTTVGLLVGLAEGVPPADGVPAGEALGVADGAVLGVPEGVAPPPAEGVPLGVADGVAEGVLLGVDGPPLPMLTSTLTLPLMLMLPAVGGAALAEMQTSSMAYCNATEPASVSSCTALNRGGTQPCGSSNSSKRQSGQPTTWSSDRPRMLGAGPVPLATMVTPATSLNAGCGNVTRVGPAALLVRVTT